ncbi:MAG TPA: hypothetical protein VN853_12215 [Polyangia bacterium]|nr:hypothetical protein [Polyangia bacterium]
MGRSAVAALSLLAMTGAVRAQTAEAPETERYTLRAEVGLEYDSNVHRAEIVARGDNPPLVASPLERLVLAATLSDVVADGQLLTLGATAAGKIFDAPAARDENVAIAQSSLAWAKVLSPRATFTLAGAYYEAFQPATANLIDASERRDFRSLAPAAQLGLLPGPGLELSLSAGYRFFVFKPDREDDFSAPALTADLRWVRQSDGDADWEASTGAGYEHRTFGGPVLVPGSSCPPWEIPPGQTIPPGLVCSGPDTRVDDFLMAHLDLQRVGRVLIGGGYAFHYNLSNSFGETVMRHIATARFAAPLPAGLTLAARAEILLAFYSQPQVIGAIAAGNSFSSIESIDDENRSSVRVDLSREIEDRVRVVARYTFYANEIANASPISYRRQTFLLSVIGSLEK